MGKVRRQRISACPICKGSGWVCENHRDRSWPDECDCGAGAPCVCNTHADFIAGEMPDNPPDVTGIMKSVIRVRGKKVN